MSILPGLPALPAVPLLPPNLVPQLNQGAGNLVSGKTNIQAYLYTFGDSYSTTGYDPHNTLGEPTLLNPLGNPSYPGVTTAGTFLGNWVDKLTYDYLPSNYTLYTYNYAVAGAVINFARYPYFLNVTDFIGQTNNFLTAGTRPPFTSSQAAAVTYWGTNDIFVLSASADGAQSNDLITATMDDYWTEMEDIYAAGVRNFVILLADRETSDPFPYRATPLTTSAIERTPRALAVTSVTDFVQIVASNRADWNAQLEQRIEDFRAVHADAHVAIVDTETIFDAILDNPTAHGSPDNTCFNADGTSCLWWDDLHPGQAIHTGIANGVATALVELGFFP